MRILGTTLFLSGLLWTSAAAAVSCSVPHFHFVDGGTTPAQMFTGPGTPCAFYFKISEFGRGDAGILSSRVTTRPKYGVLGHSSVRLYAYQPAAGYTGTDLFEVDIRYDRSGKMLARTMQVQVNISN